MNYFLRFCLLILIVMVVTITLVYNNNNYRYLVKFKLNEILFSSRNNQKNNGSADSSKLGADIIIVGQGRSGTTFLGELFNQHPDVFYVFEPLMFTTRHLNVNLFYDNETQEYKSAISSTLASFLYCNFSSKSDILKDNLAGSFPLQSNVLKNYHISKTIDKSALEFLVFNLSKSCAGFKHRVIKVLSGRLSNLSIETMEDVVDESLSRKRELKIIHLVRDPRAVVHSWIHYSWINDYHDSHFARNVKRICQPVENNLRLSRNPPVWLRKRYKLVCFESMVTDPLKIAKEVYDFVEMKMPSQVKRWIDSRKKKPTKEDLENSLSTLKNKSVSINQWRKELEKNTTSIIENVCSYIIKYLDLN